MLLGKKISVFVSITLIFSMESFFIFQGNIFAETEDVTDRILISEIMISGKSAEGKEVAAEEFIELYNPTDHEIDLEGWKIKRTTSTGGDGGYISSNLGAGGKKIPAKGYFLLVPKSVCGNTTSDIKEIAVPYLGNMVANACYSNGSFLADNNSIAIYYDAWEEADKADSAGWGSVFDAENKTVVSTYPLSNLSPGESWARKVVDGKMQDTGNDVEDFIKQSIPTPQSSAVANDGSNGGGSNSSGSDSGSSSESSSDAGTDKNENQETAGSGTESGSSSNNSGTGSDSGTSESSSQPSGDQNDGSQNTSQQSGSSGSGTGSGQTAEKKIIINEMLINPEGDDGKLEFIELYNKGKNAVDISGWSLEDQIGKSTGKFVFAKGTIVEAGKYKAFYSSDTKLSLNNSGDGAVLKDETGEMISKTPVSLEAKEEISYALNNKSAWVWTTVPTPGSENIIKEKEDKNAKDDTGKNNASDKDEQKSNSTDAEEDDKSQESAFESESYDFSDKVMINEIFSDPPGKDNKNGNYEWVEIFNGDDRAVNLRGWFVDDVSDKGSKPFRFEEDRIIPAQEYIVLSSEESKILLNNSDEEINLLWPDGKVADSISYDKAKENNSYSLSSDGTWFWTEAVTPGKENAPMPSDVDIKAAKEKMKSADSHKNSSDFTEEDESDTGASGEVLGANTFNKEEYTYATIIEAKKMPLGAKVGLDGVVATPPGIFGKNIFYLVGKDSSEGLQMFSYGGNVPVLNLGDRVQVFGFMSQSGGEKRLVLNDNFQIEKIDGDNLLNAAALRPGDVEENTPGNLAKMEGVVSEIISDNLIILSDDSGKIKVYAKPSTGVSFGDIKSGARLSIIGQVSCTSAGYRILPRFESDVRLLENGFDGIMKKENVGTVPEKHIPSDWVQAFFLLSSLIVLDWMCLRMAVKAKRS